MSRSGAGGMDAGRQFHHRLPAGLVPFGCGNGREPNPPSAWASTKRPSIRVPALVILVLPGSFGFVYYAESGKL